MSPETRKMAHTPTPCENPTKFGALTLATKRVAQNGMFIIEAPTNIPNDTAAVALVTYRPHAAFIVKACNAHDELVRVLERAYMALCANDLENVQAAKEARAVLAEVKS